MSSNASSRKLLRLGKSVGQAPVKRPVVDALGAAISGLLVVALLLPVAYRGWIPHDEGTLGQTATRILDGQWPHVDFLDVYPGFQGVIHAGVFELAGESIASLRSAWLVVAALAAFSLFYLLRHSTDRRLSVLGAVSLTVVSFVVYPASMPTWWNLSLGLAALALVYSGWLRNQAGYILGAGLITGCSILIKTTGGVFVAIAVFLWLLFTSEEHRPRWYGYMAVGLALAVIALLLAPALTVGRLLLLGIPAAFSVVLLRMVSGGPESRGQLEEPRSAKFPWLFAGGVLLMPSLTVVLYLYMGRVDALVTGWVLSPALRFEGAAGDIPVVPTALLLLTLIVIAVVLALRTGIKAAPLSAGLGAALLAWALLDWVDFARTYFLMMTWTALLIAFGTFWWRKRLRTDRLVLLVVPTALLFSLVQIPLWNGFYAAYTMPLLGLSLILLIPRGRLVAILLVGLTAGVLLYQSTAGRLVGPLPLEEPVPYVHLSVPRAGISVPFVDGYYDELAMEVANVAGTLPIFAGPDAPEVAFLAGVDSGTAAFFEVLDPDWEYDRVAQLARRGSAIVVNTRPNFSDPIPDDVLADVQDVHSGHTTIGKFLLSWSDSDE